LASGKSQKALLLNNLPVDAGGFPIIFPREMSLLYWTLEAVSKNYNKGEW